MIGQQPRRPTCSLSSVSRLRAAASDSLVSAPFTATPLTEGGVALLIESLRVGVFTAPFTRAGTAERALAPLVIGDLVDGGDMETEDGLFGGGVRREAAEVAI